MTTTNKLDKSFGPIGSPAGVFMFIIGLIATYFSIILGLILVLVGAFMGFTSTSTVIDYDKRRIKLSNNLFGVFKTGQWINIEPSMKIGIKKSNRAWRAYSRSNRTLDIAIKDYRIILYDSNDKQIMPIKKIATLESAKMELELLSNKMGLSIV